MKNVNLAHSDKKDLPPTASGKSTRVSKDSDGTISQPLAGAFQNKPEQNVHGGDFSLGAQGRRRPPPFHGAPGKPTNRELTRIHGIELASNETPRRNALPHHSFASVSFVRPGNNNSPNQGFKSNFGPHKNRSKNGASQSDTPGMTHRLLSRTVLIRQSR
jgi:hypothetical protein